MGNAKLRKPCSTCDTGKMTSKSAAHSIDDLELYASQHLPKYARDYFNGGALDSVTLRANLDAFKKYYIRPRVLRDVSKLSLSTRCFPGGNEIPFPCCVAPAAMQRMAHPDGEAATARACGSYGTVMGVSSFSTTALEDVKTHADAARKRAGLPGSSECVLQMYLFEDRKTSEDLIGRAESKGNLPQQRMRERDQEREQELMMTHRLWVQGYSVNGGHALFRETTDRDPERLQTSTASAFSQLPGQLGC